MLRSGLVALAAAAVYPAATTAQQSGWIEENQVNATMCSWEQPRAAVIRDVLYVDGGKLWWLPGLADGQFGPVNSDGNPLGLVYALNFSTPFNTSQNVSALFRTLSKAPNGGAANNIAPNYYDGAMLGNDGEWFLYGGLLRKTDAFAPPREDDVTGYQAYSYGVEKPSFRPGFLNARLDPGVTRYVAYGGGASAPSENKAWYFSGMRAAGFGDIFTVSANDSLNANNVSNTLITLDMTTQQKEKWTNATLPDFIKGRANPELVWVPVGAQGILVALGGVVYPDFVRAQMQSANEAASSSESPKFMTTIDIYDIAGNKWYQQPTTGGPQALARGCAVVAAAQDGSSFNIYYYGGYDGIHHSLPFNDDVWILSLPSFMWMKVYSSKSARHGRAGHKCVKPYPDQMFVVGGYASLTGSAPTCVDGGILQVFNLSSGEWLDSYDPGRWHNYTVPDMIYNMIGGSETGGATMRTPTPTGWATPELAQVFATPYQTAKIASFYPYTPDGPAGTRPNYPGGGGGGGGVPSFVPPLLGTVCGLMLLSAIGVAILLYRRRRLLRTGAASDAGTDDSGNRIFSWLRAQPSENKAPTVVTASDETPISPETEQLRSPLPLRPPVVHYEVADNQLAELPDTSRRVELQDTGLTPVEIIENHSHFAAARGGSLNNSSFYSSVAQADHASTVSRSSGQGVTPLQPAPQAGVRPDSPPLGAPTYEAGPGGAGSVGSAAAGVGTGAAAARGVSGVSGLSERDRVHLRQISDTTVSSVDTRGQASLDQPRGGPRSPGLVPSTQPPPLFAGTPPVSPPSPGREGDDYMNPRRAPSVPGVSPGAASTSSPLRRSVFQENEEDMDGRR